MTEPSGLPYFAIHNDLADRELPDAHPLAGVPIQDRDTVLRSAMATAPTVTDLLSGYPVLYADGRKDASRLAFSCLSAAATFPGGELDRLSDLAALTMLLFGVDDVTDEVLGGVTDSGFASFTTELAAVLATEHTSSTWDPAEPAGQVMAAWTWWCARFRRYPNAAPHVPNLARRLDSAAQAMANERRWTSGQEPWPSYQDYVTNGLITIFYPLWWAAALGICGPIRARPEHGELIARATARGAACIRLANDIRTFEREKSEGKPNGIALLGAMGVSEAEAIHRVVADIGEHEAAFQEELLQFPAELEDIAEFQRRSVRFHYHWFMARDTHAFSIQELIDGT